MADQTYVFTIAADVLLLDGSEIADLTPTSNTDVLNWRSPVADSPFIRRLAIAFMNAETASRGGGAPTAAFILELPTDGAVAQSVTPTLDWADSAGQDRYYVEIATDAGFTTIVNTAIVTDSTHVVTPALAAATQHFWRVTAISKGGFLESTADFSFTTA